MTNNGDQTNAGGGQSIRVAITPTWEAVAKISVEALLNGTTNGQSMAREEIIDLGIKLDDAKEIIEERLKPTPSLQVQFGETEALIEEKDKTIAELKERVDKQGRTIDNLMDERDEWRGVNHKEMVSRIADLECQLAMKNQQIERFEKYRAEQIRYYNERNILREGTPKLRNEEPIHDQLVDFLHASEFGRKHNLDEEAEDLVAVREFVIYTLNRNAKHREENAELEEVGE